MTHVDLFSGIGGFALAAQWAGFETVAFVEIEPYAQEIIKQNFGAVADTETSGQQAREMDRDQQEEVGLQVGTLSSRRPRLYRNIFQFDGTRYRGATLLTGGFPCQPFSQAGKRRGAEDDRYLWPEMLRVISEARPRWVLGENVAGIITMEFDRVLSDLEGEGYSCQALVIPACAVDAKHRRDRVWIIAYHAGDLRRTLQGNGADWQQEPDSRQQQTQLERNDGALADDGGAIEWRDSRIRRRVGEHAEVTQNGGRGNREADGVWAVEPDHGGDLPVAICADLCALLDAERAAVDQTRERAIEREMKQAMREWSGNVSEKVFMSQVRQLARMYGWKQYHTWNSFRSTEGFPDLVLVRPPRLIFAELKSEKGKATEAQLEWLHGFRSCNLEAYVWRPSDFDEIERILRR